MADYDRKSTIIGRDAETADGADPIGQSALTARKDDGGKVAAPPECENLDIIFEREDFQDMRH